MRRRDGSEAVDAACASGGHGPEPRAAVVRGPSDAASGIRGARRRGVVRAGFIRDHICPGRVAKSRGILLRARPGERIRLMAHLFISYSRRDSEFVDRLIVALECYGFQTWEDLKALAGGDIWKAAISKAVRECDAFLIILSPESVSSENVSKELAV